MDINVEYLIIFSFSLKYFDKSMQETKYDKPRTKESFEEFIADKLGRATPADAVSTQITNK